MSNSTNLTTEEIQQYREQLKQLKDNAKALEDIDLIDRCNGDLKYAAERLARRSNIDIVRANEENIWQKAQKLARKLVCYDQVKDDLAPNILGGLIGLFASCGNPILGVLATTLSISIVREGLFF